MPFLTLPSNILECQTLASLLFQTSSIKTHYFQPAYPHSCPLAPIPQCALIRPPGTTVPDGLICFTRDVVSFFFLFRQSFSELPVPIALKLCHMVGIWLSFIIPLQKLGGGPPKKLGAKNMQNFGQFCTTADFDREYLRNG